MNDFNITILSDNPEENTEKIKFDFQAYRNTFVDIISEKRNQTPLVIGLEGRWGRGKTTLMRAIKSELDKLDQKKPSTNTRRCKTVWFQAWKYNDADNLLAALLESIVQEMDNGNFFEKYEIRIKKLWDKINLKAVPEFFADYLPILKGISKVVKEEEYKKNLPYFTLFSSFLKELIKLWIHCEDAFSLAEGESFHLGGIDDQRGVLVVFIDDLDRCNTQNIVKVLEAIKLFLDFKGCIFVIGISKDIVINALKSAPHVGEAYAREYLEKMIQVSYELPLIHQDDMKEYFQEIVEDFPNNDILVRYSSVIVESLGDTPRKIKRFINDLNLQLKIAFYKGLFERVFVEEEDGTKKKIGIEDYIHWNILKETFQKEFSAIKNNPGILVTLRTLYKRHREEIDNNQFDNSSYASV